jgi:hypothetical protein
MREVDPSTSEQTFVLAALNKGLRTDGRAPYDQRALKLTFGDEPGWVECRLGETKCVYPELILTAGARVERVQELIVFFFLGAQGGGAGVGGDSQAAGRQAVRGIPGPGD